MKDSAPRITITDLRARLEAKKAGAPAAPAPPVRAPEPPAAVRNQALVALVHDGSDRGVLELAIAGMAKALEGSDRALVLQALPAGPSAADAVLRLRTILHRLRPAGIVLLPPLSERDDLCAICEAAQVRCVRLGRSGEGLICDDRGAMAAVVHWLVEQGHQRIGLVGGPEASLTAQQRELGYLDALADHGLDRGPSLIVAGDNSFASGVSAGRLLLEVSPRPTAIVAGNDEMAAGVLAAAAQAGVPVPAALSVVGFDDAPLAARTVPALTSVHVPWQSLAQEAVARIIGGWLAPEAAGAFAAALVLRDSVSAAAPSASQ